LSLILEALKKLEREKQAPDKGFLVVAHVPWAVGSRGWPRGPLALGIALCVAAAAAGLWLVRRSPAVAREAPAPAPVKAKAPATASVPAIVPVQPSTTPDPALLVPSPHPPLTLETRPPVRPVPPRSATVRPGLPTPAARSTPAPPSTPPEVALRLNAISAQDGRPVAMLNDRLVREGDVFDGIRVLRIGETEVEVEVKGRKLIVTF